MPTKKKKESKDGEQLTRIAIVNGDRYLSEILTSRVENREWLLDRCKPKKCRQECRRCCPVVKTGETALNQVERHAIPDVCFRKTLHRSDQHFKDCFHF